jgi:hypothetical protein
MSRILLRFTATSALLVLFAALAQAQAPIRATTTLHPDGNRTTTIVDPEKMTAEETLTDAKGKTLRKVTYLLDEQNQPLGSIAYDAKGTILYRASYKRDAAGRIEEENISSAEGEFIRKRVYVYGAQNKVINAIEYDAQGRVIPKARKATAVSPGRPDKKK